VPPSRPLKRAHLLRWRPRQQVQRTESTPHLLPSGAASHLGLFEVRRGKVLCSCRCKSGLGSCRFTPVATEAARRATDSLKLSGQRPTKGGSASRRAATRVKPEQASKENRERRPALKTGKAAGSRRSNRPTMTRSLTGVVGVARRHRAWCNTGGPSRRRVAVLTSTTGWKPRWASEGRTVPHGPAGQQNRTGGKAPWFGVCLDESRGGRLA